MAVSRKRRAVTAAAAMSLRALVSAETLAFVANPRALALVISPMAVADTERVGARPKTPLDVPVVELNDVTKVYDGGSVAVQSASMRIGRGEFVFLVGPTGCGKSTCIRLLMKELEPSRGEIAIAGR